MKNLNPRNDVKIDALIKHIREIGDMDEGLESFIFTRIPNTNLVASHYDESFDGSVVIYRVTETIEVVSELYDL